MAGLSSLLDPIAPEQFMSEYWCVRHLLIHRPITALDGFAKTLLDLPIKDILRCAEEPVIVMHTTTSGHYRGSTVSKSQAFNFFESGMALYFNVSSVFQDVREWTNALAHDLGQVPNRCKASLFITPANWTTEEHFDPNENFTIQLRGHKQWNIASNDSVRHPVDRFTCSEAVPPRMSSYYLYKNLVPPTVGCTEQVQPGSMLYVPRGHWHSVESVTESVSLNFCIVPETWVSLLIPLIERLLLTSPELREVATGVAGTEILRKSAFEKLKQILPHISQMIGNLRPQHIFPEMPPNASRPLMPENNIIRNRLATVVCDSAADKNIKVTITAHNFLGSTPAFLGPSQASIAGPRRVDTISIPEEQLSLLEWIVEQGSFTSGAAKSHFNNLSPDQVGGLIGKLVQVGLLYVDSADAHAAENTSKGDSQASAVLMTS
jgi:50S ribosomal protein L16 3-hydroxylase